MAEKKNFHYGAVFTYSYIVLLVTELCVKMCMYMQHATVTLYILDSGGSATFVGGVLAVQLLSSLVFRPISGNLIDRIARHYVVDFIEVLFTRFAVFNFADCCVTIGAALLILSTLVSFVKESGGNKD